MRATQVAFRQQRPVAMAAPSCFIGPVAEPGSPLELEARLFTRYLVGRPPARHFVQRYQEANRVLSILPEDGREAAVLDFVRRHPWSVGFLDAACGLLRPGGLLRTRILIMAAILEASPEFAEDFLPREARPLRLLAGWAARGLFAVTRAILGMLIYPIAALR